MSKWTYTQRRANDYLIHLPGEKRGICVTWELNHANRIASALNTAPFPGTPSDAIDKLRTAGGLLLDACEKLVDPNGDVSINNLADLANCAEYWRITVRECSPTSNLQHPTSNKKDPTHG